MTAQRRPPPPATVDVSGLLQDILDQLKTQGEDLGQMRLDHGQMKATLGETGRGGSKSTGLVGAVETMEGKIEGLLSLKNRGAGILLGIVFVLVIAGLVSGKAIAGAVGGLQNLAGLFG